MPCWHRIDEGSLYGPSVAQNSWPVVLERCLLDGRKPNLAVRIQILRIIANFPFRFVSTEKPHVRSLPMLPPI